MAAKPGIKVFPSKANFLLIQVADATGFSASLAEVGIVVRDFSQTPGLAGCLRITVGTETDNKLLLKAVEACSKY